MAGARYEEILPLPFGSVQMALGGAVSYSDHRLYGGPRPGRAGWKQRPLGWAAGWAAVSEWGGRYTFGAGNAAMDLEVAFVPAGPDSSPRGTRVVVFDPEGRHLNRIALELWRGRARYLVLRLRLAAWSILRSPSGPDRPPGGGGGGGGGRLGDPAYARVPADRDPLGR
jgi:hypothetical protein